MSTTELHSNIRKKLINSGLTFSDELEWAGQPTLMREVEVDAVVKAVIDCLIGADYGNRFQTKV